MSVCLCVCVSVHCYCYNLYCGAICCPQAAVDVAPFPGVIISVGKKQAVHQTEYNSIVAEVGGDYQWKYTEHMVTKAERKVIQAGRKVTQFERKVIQAERKVTQDGRRVT